MRNIDFMSKRKTAAIGSVIAVVASLAYIQIFGIPKNVDFEGGTRMSVAFRGDITINTLRDAVNPVESKATIVEEKVESGSRFSLKIKNPEVEEGKETEASELRRRNLEDVFASLNNEDKNIIDALAAMDQAELSNRMMSADIYSIEGADSDRQAAYNDLAGKVKAAAAGATTLAGLTQQADAAKASELATALLREIMPAIDHTTADALKAILSAKDPLGRGENGNYDDVVSDVEASRAATGDFVESIDAIALDSLSAEDAAKTKAFLNANFILSQYRIVANETFSPSIAAELVSHAQDAILLALIGILIYIGLRFDANYAIASVVALAHDIIIALGVFALGGSLLGVELSNPVVAAFLTIVGYSLNDTIVVFDRIRDNRSDIKNPDLLKVMNTSINQTLSRTLVTSLTTFFVVAVIYWGSNNATLQDFAFPLLIGIIVGTYSSIFVASPTLLYLTEKKTLSNIRGMFSGKKSAARSTKA